MDNGEKNKLMIARDQRVVKANELIQKSRFSLSAKEQKIILFIISKIKPGDDDFREFNFSILDFCKLCGLGKDSGGNYEYIKKTIKKLRDRSLWVKVESGEEVLMSWIARSRISESGGVVTIRLDEEMKPYLLKLKERFTQYNLVYTLAMSSQYSIRLYELLKSFEWQHEKEIRIDELKSILFAQKYARFPDFKRKVLDIALEEIATYSDLNVFCDYKKEGRQYTSVIFKIKEKKDADRQRAFKNIDGRLNPEAPTTGVQGALWQD